MRCLAPLIFLLACSSRTTAPGPAHPKDGGEPQDACQALEQELTSLYREQATQEGVAPALQDEFVADNLHMVLSDCRAAPKTVLPCLQRVSSVPEIERSCLIPLDDEGQVEGKRFGGTQ